MKPREYLVPQFLTWTLFCADLLYVSGLGGGRDQEQSVSEYSAASYSDGDVGAIVRKKRETNDVGGTVENYTSVAYLNDSHLNLMVHWAGRGSSVVFCLAKDQKMEENSTSRVFLSEDYATSFVDISSRFKIEGGENATINKFFHHPNNNCYYVFTDILQKYIFTSMDCGETIVAHKTQFIPEHVEFDKKQESRFLVHNRRSSNKSLFVTANFGKSFSHAGEYVKSFFWDYREDETVLYVARAEPSGTLNVLQSTSFFERQVDTKVVYTGADEFEKKGNFLFAVKKDRNDPENKNKILYVARPEGRFVAAEFPDINKANIHYDVVDVTEDDGVMVIVNHNDTYSNLYVSEKITEHEVTFTLSLERIMYYNSRTTWRNTWLSNLASKSSELETTFADFYKVAGLRGIYIASQVSPDASHKDIRPENLSTLITYDAGGEWNPVIGPKTDNRGHPVVGCSQINSDCSLHIAQQLSRKFPSTRSIPILTSAAAPGVVLASGNMGTGLRKKTNVYLSADAGVSWHQVLQGGYYYNIGDHGGVIVAVKYFKTEGNTDEILYTTDEGVTWNSHKFYHKPIRIFGLITEPGENTTIFTMFGTDVKPQEGINWIIVKVDLTKVFKRNCTDTDYKDWSPVAPGEGENTKSRCILGKKEVYKRRAPSANCYNGMGFTRPSRVDTCPCNHMDYQCAWGFKRDGDRKTSCVKDSRMDINPFDAPASCKAGEFYNMSKGYQRIAGDVCQGGLSSRYEPEKRACPYEIATQKTFMLVAQRQKIVKLDLTKPNSTVKTLPLLNVKNVIAMDFDYSTDCVFWADIELDKIMKQCMRNSSEVEILAETDLQSVEGMAYDQISSILYFVDGTRKAIELVRVDMMREGHMRKKILGPTELGPQAKPRGLAVHPKQGYIFYSDWAEKAARIGRANLDGTDYKTIVSLDSNNRPLMEWPNGLTVDIIQERLYWVDAKRDYIASSTLDGDDFKKVLSGRSEVAHPFAVAVLKGLVYWDDWTRKAIFLADKDSGEGITVVQKDMAGAMDLKVYSPHILQMKNACSSKPCSHLCIALPPHYKEKYRCLCPDGMKASGDGDKSVCKCPDDSLPDEVTGSCHALQNGTCADGQWQCGNKLCVPRLWKCDGDNDCGDNSDETNCHQDQCRGKQFQCENKKCIPEHWRCDYDDDCGDNSDEQSCPSSQCDANTQFRCNNGQCVNKKWKCDLEKDCQDGSDEANCTKSPVACASNTLTCKTGGMCLPKGWRCDGDHDCPDGSDEQDCSSSDAECQDWQFRCNNGHCIFSTWKCDGDADCSDNSDESDCEAHTNSTGTDLIIPEPNFPKGDCNEWMFKCKSEQCIPFWWKCDGVADCSDRSDEEDCGPIKNRTAGQVTTSKPFEPAVVGCSANKFQCHNGQCIWSAWLCDGENDCHDGEDELQVVCQDKKTCTPGQFRCEFSGQCVGIEKLCDDHPDCDDGSDEFRCHNETQIVPVQTCDGEHFTCDDGRNCFSLEKLCDGHQDCFDLTDEEMCHMFGGAKDVDVDEDSREVDSLLVQWWHSDINTSHHLKYKFSFTIAGHNDWANTTEDWIDADLEYRYENLHPATTYDFKVYVKSDNGDIYPPTNVAIGKTIVGVPSPPRKLEVRQDGGEAVLTWSPPIHPAGSIKSYTVKVFQNGELKEETEVTPLANPRTSVASISGLTYSYQVFVDNELNRSQGSNIVTKTMAQMVPNFKLVKKTNTTLEFTWDKTSEAISYKVRWQSIDNKLDGGTNRTVAQNKIIIQTLSPKTSYTVRISAITQTGESPSYMTKVDTEGTALPLAYLVKASVETGNIVELVWTVNSEDDSRKLTYGIWYGVSEEELIMKGPRYYTSEHSIKIKDLSACTDYLFIVAVFQPALGKMSNQKPVNTRFDHMAPPKDVRVENRIVYWKPSCPAVSQPLGYVLTLRDNLFQGTKIVSLEKSSKSSLSYTFQEDEVVPGGIYEVSVRTNETGSKSSPSVEMRGAQIAPPMSVRIDNHDENGGFRVSWADKINSPVRKYVVILSEDPEFKNLSGSLRFPVAKSPFFISRDKITAGHDYYVAVAAEKGKGYRSAWANGNSIITSERFKDEIVVKESSMVGTGVAVFVVIMALVALVAYYAIKHRRLHRTFREFAATHYSSATGRATLNHSVLIDDDDESPIIRGFADDEPLVVA